MTLELQDDKGLSIYWDYHTTQLNLNLTVSGYEVVRRIRSAMHVFGPIQSFKMYHDSSQSLSNLRSELCSSGVTLIDCHGPNEAATKMMMVDIIMHTLDHPAPRTVVIISGDRYLAYMIAALRMRKYQVVLISPSGTHPSLTNQASVNLDWITADTTDMDDPCAPHPPHQVPSFSFSSLPLPTTGGHYSHYPKTNFLSKAQEIDPESERFNIFGGSFPSPSNSNSMFGLGPLFSRSQPPDSAPPSIVYSYSTYSPTSSPDSNGFGGMPSSAKGKQREFPITEPEDTAPQKQWTANMPEEPRSARMAEAFFTSMHPSAKMNTPLTTGTPSCSSLSSQDSRFSAIQFPPSSVTTSVNIAKNSPLAGLPIQSQVLNPFRPVPTPLLPSQKVYPPKETTLNTQVGPSSIPSHKYVPLHFRVLVETLRQHGGSHVKHTLPTLLLARDPQVYQNAQVHKYKAYIAAAVEAGLVREVRTMHCKYLCISLTQEYT